MVKTKEYQQVPSNFRQLGVDSSEEEHMASGDRKVLMKAHEAAQYLRTSLFALNKIESRGELRPSRTPGGHRRYSLEMLNRYFEENCSPIVALN